MSLYSRTHAVTRAVDNMRIAMRTMGSFQLEARQDSKHASTRLREQCRQFHIFVAP